MKNLSFARKRLNALLLAQGFGFIAGIMPVTIGVLFVGKLVYCGSGYLFAKYQGEFRRDRAREVVGMSLELAALVGLFIWTTIFLGRDLYFDLMGLTGLVREQAVSYWRWNAVFLAIFHLPPVAI